MKPISIILCIFLLAACMPATPTAAPLPTSQPTPTAQPMPSGAYLGETPPGASPRIFAPAIVHTDLHSPPVFAADGTEIYWGAYDDGGKSFISASKLVNGNWSPIKRLALSDTIKEYGDPFITSDGSKFFFISDDVIPGASNPGKENIWVAERQGDGWGQPTPLPTIVNAFFMHWTFSTTLAGDLYFSAGREMIEDIFVSRWVNGEYSMPEKMDAPINTTEQYELTPYIAPDGSYLLFARLPDNNSIPRLYISYAYPDGTWSEPALIQNIPYALAPMVSPDGKYVFYLSNPNNVSWRDTSFIEELRPK